MRVKIHSWVTLAAVLLAPGGCADPLATDPTEGSPLVVQGFLFAGRPVSEIRVSRVVPTSATNSEPEPIADARVSLTKGGTEYPLQPLLGSPGVR